MALAQGTASPRHASATRPVSDNNQPCRARGVRRRSMDHPPEHGDTLPRVPIRYVRGSMIRRPADLGKHSPLPLDGNPLDRRRPELGVHAEGDPPDQWRSPDVVIADPQDFDAYTSGGQTP